MYDYLIVGSGLYGSIFAREATKKGYKVLVIDKRKTLAVIFIQKKWRELITINTAHIFSILIIKKSGII